ncbi:MAG: hypothetical protein K2F78_01225 [Muribaculaceae bacterium]|nr:hypothetical protein [Muribaculaceae bacterium]
MASRRLEVKTPPQTAPPDGRPQTGRRHTPSQTARRRRQAGGTHRRRPPDAADRPEACSPSLTGGACHPRTRANHHIKRAGGTLTYTLCDPFQGRHPTTIPFPG